MPITRRRFLTLASAACLVSPVRAAAAYRWEGVALGARAQIVLDHPDAARIARRAAAEIDRLEDIFSLYRADSELSRLNRDGRLQAPSFEMLECLSIARRVHRTTEGRFDPTVQPLWRVLADARIAGRTPPDNAVAEARGAVGFDRVRFDAAVTTLADGQALTLNGIAQGYIADRVAALMRSEGVNDMLVDTGEIVALGQAPGAAAWPVTIKGEPAARRLSGRALATSAPLGMTIDPTGPVGHILDPRSGVTTPPAVQQISVSAQSAAIADGLSTGLALTRSRAEAAALLTADARLESFVPA